MKYAITIQGYKHGKPEFMVDRLIGPFDSVTDAQKHIDRVYHTVKPISSVYHIYEAVGEDILLQILDLVHTSGRSIVQKGNYETYAGWRRASKEHGAVKFEGDKDIAQAFDSTGFAVGEWDGTVGYIFIKK